MARTYIKEQVLHLDMDLEGVFYAIAGLFGLAAIVYFAWEYLDVLPRITKSILLFGIAGTLFLIGGLLREVDR